MQDMPTPFRHRGESVLRWCFESRQTGRITIAQVPNGPLWVFLAALLCDALLHPTGRMGLAITLVKATALTVWALDEVIRGCNPWRRALGVGVLVYELLSWAVR